MLKRAHQLLLLLILLTVAARLIYGWHVHRQLISKLETLRAQGLPTQASHFNYPPLPDAENAALLIKAASDQISKTVDSPRNGINMPPINGDIPEKWRQEAAASESASAGVFPLARKIRNFPLAQFRKNFRTDYSDQTYLNPTRSLANVLCDGALYQHLLGNDREALERIIDAEQLGDRLLQDELVISELVAVGIYALNADALHDLALRIDFSKDDLLKAQARELISRLLKDDDISKALPRGFVSERVYTVDYYAKRARDRWLVRPFIEKHSLRQLDDIDRLIPLLSKRSWPAFTKAFESKTLEPISYPKWASSWRDYYSYIGSNFRATANRRATATAVAIRLFFAEHRRFPKTLDELVPAYLSVIPADPYRTDLAPIGYQLASKAFPDGSDRPLLYFDSGSDFPELLRNFPMFSWQNDPRQTWERTPGEIRQYRDLKLFVFPPPPKTTQPTIPGFE